jgi:hypothetical protein
VRRGLNFVWLVQMLAHPLHVDYVVPSPTITSATHDVSTSRGKKLFRDSGTLVLGKMTIVIPNKTWKRESIKGRSEAVSSFDGDSLIGFPAVLCERFHGVAQFLALRNLTRSPRSRLRSGCPTGEADVWKVSVKAPVLRAA